MRNLTPKKTFELLARWAVGGILVYAGFVKAAGPAAEFAANIAAYQILPAHWVTPLAFVLPWIEMWVGLFLICGYHRRASARAATVLFIMFIGALGWAILRHLDLNTCGCFGQEAFTPKQTILGDVVFLALAVSLSFLREAAPWLSFDPWLERG